MVVYALAPTLDQQSLSERARQRPGQDGALPRLGQARINRVDGAASTSTANHRRVRIDDAAPVLRAKNFGATYIFVDTASQTFHGNQNNETQVIAFINRLRQLALAIQGVVILTKHPSIMGRKGTGESGTTQWNNQVRSRLYFKKEKSGVRTLEGVKNNYGLPMKAIALKYRRGVFVREDQPQIPSF